VKPFWTTTTGTVTKSISEYSLLPEINITLIKFTNENSPEGITKKQILTKYMAVCSTAACPNIMRAKYKIQTTHRQIRSLKIVLR
jgi:hypothetical protein